MSAKRLAANRLNAQRSTGPRTSAGKARVARNAIKHGIFAKVPLLVALGESPEDWQAHRDGIVTSLAPKGHAEQVLAERVASILWRVARAARADAAVAAVAFLPVASLANQPVDHTACEPWFTRLKELRGRAAAVRTAAATLIRLAEYLGQLTGIDDGEPIEPDDALTVWNAAVGAAGRPPNFDGPRLALEVLVREGLSEPDLALDRRFHGWTVGRLRTGIGHLASLGATRDAADLIASAIDILRQDAAERVQNAEACEACANRLEGERVANRVREGLAPAAAGFPILDLVARYERTLGGELERTMRLLDGLQAARSRRTAGSCD